MLYYTQVQFGFVFTTEKGWYLLCLRGANNQ